MLDYSAALARLLLSATGVSEHESVPLEKALQRVLARPLYAPTSVPPYDNSAVDGYALRASDVQHLDGCLPISQRIAAGDTARPLEPTTAARIFTGAILPDGADTVVMQENSTLRGDKVSFSQQPRIGEHIRRAGFDVAAGQLLLPAGTRLRPQHISLAAACGLAQLPVWRRIKVAFLCTGDELTTPGQALLPGKIYNSNRYAFIGLLQQLDCHFIDLGRVVDRFEQTAQALRHAGQQADVVLSSGGVSVGEEDHVRRVIEQEGSLSLWKVAIRPGKPLLFGHMEETPIIGLPGNPVSLFVGFFLFVYPFLLRMQGDNGPLPQAFRLPADFDWLHPDPRQEYVRAVLVDNGQAVSALASRSSASVQSLALASGLAVIPPATVIKKGDPVEYLPFSGWR